MMDIAGIDREQVLRYLLRQASESEAAELEKVYFASPEKLEEISEIENDLVDDFVSGRLSPASLTRFEEYYLASPLHRQKVAFARALSRQTFVSKGEEVQHGEAASGWQSLLRSLRAPIFAAGFAFVSVLLVAVVIWAVLANRRSRVELAEAQQRAEVVREREQKLRDQIAAKSSENEELSTELEQLRQQQTELETRIAAQTSAPPAVISFILNPGLARAGSQTPKLVIRNGAKTILFKINFENADYRSYEIELKTVAGPHVFSQRSLRARKLAAGGTVSGQVPAAKLARGDYILTLSGLGPGRKVEEVNRYFFRVDRK